jgi:hypothetical protein
MAKLFAIFASEAPVAVIIRRGPSAWTHIIRWDVEQDVFERGAWIRGRIYPQKCDISPSGELFVYFVLQGNRSDTPFTHAYTAVSRVPWLKALMVVPHGTTYGGGGRFISERQFAIRGLWFSPVGTLPDFPSDGLEVVEADAPYHESSGEVEGADWSSRDRKNRLAFSRGGKLYRREGASDLLLADFDDLLPNPQPAPEWAGAPLKDLKAEKARRPKKWKR